MNGDLALTLFREGRLEEAEMLLARGGSPEDMNNRAIILQELRRLDEAEEMFTRVVEGCRDLRATAIYNRAILLLLRGNPRGLKDYEARAEVSGLKEGIKYPRRRRVSSRRVHVYHEQGFGDTIQMCRYISPAWSVEAPRPLIPLLRQLLHPSNTLYAEGDVIPGADSYIPMMSLWGEFGGVFRKPLVFREDYIRQAWWDLKLPRIDAGIKRVGLAWSGDPRHGRDSIRSIPWELVSPHLRPDTEYVCLQKDIRIEDAGALMRDPIRVASAHIHDFADTAALIRTCDSVISVDTAVAHLAGTLGVPTQVLLPFANDWRWGLEGETTPWYPSVTLRRQRVRGDWSSVLEEAFHG